MLDPYEVMFDILIDIVLTFEFCNDFMIRNTTIFNKVDYIEFEPALTKGDATKNDLKVPYLFFRPRSLIDSNWN